MKLVLALTALIVVAQAASMAPMGPMVKEMMAEEMMAKEIMAEEMMAKEMMVEAKAKAAMEFCSDVAKGEDDAAMKFVDEALAFECGKHGTKAGCDELTKDKEAGVAVALGRLRGGPGDPNTKKRKKKNNHYCKL